MLHHTLACCTHRRSCAPEQEPVLCCVLPHHGVPVRHPRRFLRRLPQPRRALLGRTQLSHVEHLTSAGVECSNCFLDKAAKGFLTAYLTLGCMG